MHGNHDLPYSRVPEYIAGMRKPCTLLTCLAFVFAFMTLASGAPDQAPDAAAKLKALSKQLELTPEQKEKLLPILKQEVPKLEALKNDTSLSGFQKMRQLRAIHTESAPQLQEILNPEQYQKLQSIREQEIKAAMEKKRATD